LGFYRHLIGSGPELSSPPLCSEPDAEFGRSGVDAYFLADFEKIPGNVERAPELRNATALEIVEIRRGIASIPPVPEEAPDRASAFRE
jgi:hypothetical protein